MRTRSVAIAIFLVALIAAAMFLFVRKTPDALGRPGPIFAEASSAAPTSIHAPIVGVRVWPTSTAQRALLTPPPTYHTDLDSVELAPQFDSLLARARKDPAFAQTFAFALYQCTLREKSYQGLQGRVQRKEVTADEAAANLAKYEGEFAKCKGLTPAQMSMSLEVAEQAARAGVLEAQLYYRTYVAQAIADGTAIREPNAMDKYRQNTESFLRAAAQSGDQEGIYAAYDFYRNGALVPPDLVQAYQYAAQFARAFPGDQAQVMMARVVKKMSPDELRRARGY